MKLLQSFSPHHVQHSSLKIVFGLDSSWDLTNSKEIFVEWGDQTTEKFSLNKDSMLFYHKYSQAGIYQIKVYAIENNLVPGLDCVF